MSSKTLPAKTNAKPVNLRDQLIKMKPEFAKALPGHISADRFLRTAQTAIALTRNIDKVTDTQSLLAACTKAAADGLILDGREAALVIDSKGNVQYRPMMRGLLKLAYNSGEIKGIVVEVVYENDYFEHEPTDLLRPIVHRINHRQERGEPIVVYGLATLRDGGIIHEVMSVAEINRIRDRSDGYKAFKTGSIKSTPWATDWSEMARKTVFRRMSKYLPSSNERDEFHRAVERIDEDYTMDLNAEPEPAQEKPQRKQRGAAAAVLKDVTPEPPPPAPEREPGEVYDEQTGEVLEHVPIPGDDF